MSAQTFCQKDWIWRGWQTRYAFQRCKPNTSGLPILLLHGFGASGGQWRRNIPVLAEQYTVYTLDLVGFGGSEKPPTRYCVNLWVEQVFDFWQTFIGQPMILVGNSIGALVSLIATHTHPEIAKGVVTISLPDLEALEAMVPPPMRPIKRSLETIISAPLLKPIFYLVRRPQTIRFVLENFVYSDRHSVDDELVEMIARPAREKRAAEAFCRLNAGVRNPGFSPSAKQAIAQLQVPLLILWGTQDRVIPPSEGRRLVKYSPLARLVELPNLGHCAHDDGAELVNTEILNWIKNTLHNA